MKKYDTFDMLMMISYMLIGSELAFIVMSIITHEPDLITILYGAITLIFIIVIIIGKNNMNS